MSDSVHIDPNPEAILRVVLREMTAIGAAWRLDSSEFDGRLLQGQLNALASWADSRLRGEGPEDFTGGTRFLAETEAWVRGRE